MCRIPVRQVDGCVHRDERLHTASTFADDVPDEQFGIHVGVGHSGAREHADDLVAEGPERGRLGIGSSRHRP
jgi:hypothetical protein